MLGAGTTTWGSLADESYIGRIANIGIVPWSTVLGGSYDDAQVHFLVLDLPAILISPFVCSGS
jgi:hypothetical protein